jgi:RNA polymerase sigma factor (sigma-70 family)
MPEEPLREQDKGRSRLKELSDEELVEAFLGCSRSNRIEAHAFFEAIIARYHGLIHHVVRSSRFRYPAWDSAEDVVARAIFKIYRGLPQWRKEGKLGSFIARIASSEMIDTMRRVNRDKSWDSRPIEPGSEESDSWPMEAFPSDGPTPEAAAAAREQHLILEQLLEEVCRDWKDSVIVNEYLVNGRSAKEIADKYDMSEDLIYQRARRLRVRLLKWLASRGITSASQVLGHTAGASPR